MGEMVLPVAIVPAMVFGVAAAVKSTDLEGLRRALVGFGVPPRTAVPLGRSLVTCEFAVALALVVPPWARVGGLGALLLLTLFSGVIALNLMLGRTRVCDCFGGLKATPVGWSTVARNALIAVLAAFVAADGHPHWLFAGLAVVMSALWAGLWAREAGEVRAGLFAPPFSLRDESGRTRSLDDLLAPGRPLLLVFSDLPSGPHAALLPQVARWQRTHEDDVTIAVLSGGPEPVPLATAGGDGPRRMLVDPDRRVHTDYGVTATPAAVLIDAEGIVAAAPAVGAAEIRNLVARALRLQGRPTAAGRVLLFASAALVPAFTTVYRADSDIAPRGRPPVRHG
ncbi:MauE/DoxX family redox-associated membrane protein [Streptomyces sp. NPDC005968]|uniref:MauE/DoxX family redox-associated membrane protein n=1 Tax=Streptomyces sp. NPDC005968 TaxID=3154574 RepID=UPI0033DA59A9